MATRKRTTKKTTALRSNSKTVKRRRSPITSRKGHKPNRLFNFMVPLVFIIAILGCLGFLLFKGYQTVTASSFFDMKKVEVRGISRVSREDIERIVRLQTEQEGVWNAKLEEIKADVEKLNFVRSAVISRILPDGILVRIEERNPKAVIRLNNGDYWADDDGVLITSVSKNENRPPSVLRGWDEEKTEKAQRENQERIRVFNKTIEEFITLGIDKKVIALNLSDLRDVTASVEDSGVTVFVNLGKEDFGKRLQSALKVIDGKGQAISYVKSYGGPVAVGPRNGLGINQ